MFAAEFAFLNLLEGIRTDFLNVFFEFITILGEETVYIVLTCVLYFMYDKKLAQKLLFIVTTSICFNSTIKNLVKLERPFASGKVKAIRAETATGYSFPSGHTQIAATSTSAIAFIFKKRWTVIFACVAIVLVGFSRLYLGVHFPTDVICGAVFGIAFAYVINKLHDRAKNVFNLYITVAIIATVLAGIFTISPNILYLDFYKAYGILLGFMVSVKFEEKFVQFNYDCSLFKKILRVVIGVVLAYALKEGIKMMLVTESVLLSYFYNALRYFLLVVIVFGLLPLIFKKIKM